MALNNNLGQVIKTNIASKFKKFVGGIGNQKLNIPSLSDFSSLTSLTSGGMKNLAFPLDVTAGPGGGNHGHYVMFFINEQTNSKLDFSGNKKDTNNIGLASQFGINDKLNGNKNIITNNINEDDPMSATNQIKDRTTGLKQNVVVKRRPTRKKVASIAMFMPAQVQTTYGANYTDTQIGMFTGDALNVYDNLTSSGANQKSAFESIKNMGTESLPTALTLMLQGTLGALPGLGGLREARGMMTGEIISDRLELAFKGVNKRQFQYTFKMLPKSAEESEEIMNIVHIFKTNMLPEFVGGNTGGRRMVVPNTFDIEYMYNGASNEYLHKIGTCVLENMTVSYGGDKYRTYSATDKGAPPVETTITLAFKEMDLVTRESIMEGK